MYEHAFRTRQQATCRADLHECLQHQAGKAAAADRQARPDAEQEHHTKETTMLIHLNAKLAAQMGCQKGMKDIHMHHGGGATLDLSDWRTGGPPAPRTAHTPPAQKAPSKLALGLAARFVATGAAADVAEGLHLAAVRFEQY